MQSFNDNFENGIHKMFDHIWDAKIEHPVFDDTVGDLMEAVIQFHHNTARWPDFMPTYEYHYDHTDCIWYLPGGRSKCPSTCAQYRDGWNDAMDYIFRNGEGYKPYRREESQ